MKRRVALIAINLAILGAAFGALAQGLPAPDEHPGSAVVMMYHRFGETTSPSTNIRVDQFDSHLRELAKGDYTVLPLPDIADAVQAGKVLPPRTIGLSIDDAYRSVYTVAWPKLKQAGHAFTLFVATDEIDAGLGHYMTWDEIRELKQAGVTIGSQTASHPHMPTLDDDQIRAELKKSQARFVAELGEAPTLFAWPYGEASAAAIDVVREAGFTAAFGQHSGALFSGAAPYYLPRFPLNETYGNAERFRQVARTLPLVVGDITPADPKIGGSANPPSFGFTVKYDYPGLAGLACYSSAEGAIKVEMLGPRVEARLKQAMAPGRHRINCTLPGGDGRWRWFGWQFAVPGRY